jgi:hypothetical protein
VRSAQVVVSPRAGASSFPARPWSTAATDRALSSGAAVIESNTSVIGRAADLVAAQLLKERRPLRVAEVALVVAVTDPGADSVIDLRATSFHQGASRISYRCRVWTGNSAAARIASVAVLIRSARSIAAAMTDSHVSRSRIPAGSGGSSSTASAAARSPCSSSPAARMMAASV